MLIQAIAFEIHNAKHGIHEEFLVEATDENYEKVLQSRFSRQIKFTKLFDFEFEKKTHSPVSFIDVPDSIDSVDEMVGTF